MPGKTAGMYPTRQGSRTTAIFFFASPPLAYDRHDLRQQKQLLAEAFADEGWEVPHLLEAMWRAPEIYSARCAGSVVYWSQNHCMASRRRK